MSNGSFGILSWGAYVPRRRLQRKVVLDAVSWFNPALKALAKGERAIANWDEDSLTMAVAAARLALADDKSARIDTILAASTSFPFADRQNSVVLAEALRVPRLSLCLDVAGSQRAGTSALVSALERRSAAGWSLVVAGDRREAKAGSRQEMLYGDAAAAVVLGQGEPLAVPLGSSSHLNDFVDHYREKGRRFDYAWEERWIRDEGLVPILTSSIRSALQRSSVPPETITRLCVPAASGNAAATVAKACGISPDCVHDGLIGSVGEAGCAHPLLVLIHALEQSKAGDRILVASFGQGSDALIFEATKVIGRAPRKSGVLAAIERRAPETNYFRYLALNDLVELDRGMRAEIDKGTALSALYRHRDMVLSLTGGLCPQCRTPQFPRSQVCVNPECHAVGEQEDYCFANAIGAVQSFTADALTFCPDPPQLYGMVQFEGGGRLMADFSDVSIQDLRIGLPVEMSFRIKERDAARGFTRYFWKAVPREIGTEVV